MRTNHWIRLFLVLISCYTTFSCTYQLSEENFVSVSKYVDPPVIVNLNEQLDKDTLYLWYIAGYEYDFASSDQDILGVNFILNGEETFSEETQGIFYINVRSFAKGVPVKFKVQVLTHSGTGSFADLVGKEGYLFEKEWVILPRISEDYSPNLKYEVTPERHLKISWDKYEDNYFHKYVIHAFDGEHFLIKDINETSFVDKRYIGGEASYVHYVELERFDEVHFKNSYSLHVNFPTSDLYFKNHNDSVTLYWDKPIFDCRYKLQKPMASAGEILKEIEQDTFVTIKSPGLGTPIDLTIYFEGKNNLRNGCPQRLCQSVEWHLGCQTKMQFDNIYADYESGCFFVAHDDSLLKYDPNNLNKYISRATIPGWPMQLTRIGEALYVVYKDVLKKFRASDLALINTFQINNREYIAQIVMVNDSIVVAKTENSMHIRNFKKDQKLFEIDIPQNVQLIVSEDENYLIVFSPRRSISIYNMNDSVELKLVYHKEVDIKEVLFDPRDSEKIWMGADNKISLFNFEENTVEKEFNNYDFQFVNIDHLNNTILLKNWRTSKICVLDLNTGKQLYYNDMYEIGFQDQLLYNNAIHLMGGIVYNLNDE